jgi:hypothetical protein
MIFPTPPPTLCLCELNIVIRRNHEHQHPYRLSRSVLALASSWWSWRLGPVRFFLSVCWLDFVQKRSQNGGLVQVRSRYALLRVVDSIFACLFFLPIYTTFPKRSSSAAEARGRVTVFWAVAAIARSIGGYSCYLY